MKDVVSGDLINYSFPDEGKFRPKWGRNKIIVELNDDFEWSCTYNGREVHGKIHDQTIDDLIGFGVIPPREDEKFKDALKLYISRALMEFKKSSDWDDKDN